MHAASEAVREGHSREVHAGRRCMVAAAVAAYGSSGLVEESAQDGDLEERVERHVSVHAHRGTAASV